MSDVEQFLSPQDQAPRVAAFADSRFVGWVHPKESDAACLERLSPIGAQLSGSDAPLQILKACACMLPLPIIDCTVCWPDEGDGQ